MNAIVITAGDNVAIVLRDITGGEEIAVAGQTVIAKEDIPYTHKIAVCDIPEGGAIIKYGETIAIAGNAIRKGQWVHVHNLQTDRTA